MTVTQAAKLIGVSATQVRYLIRKGKIKATKLGTLNNQFGYEYFITKEEAIAARSLPGPGRPKKIATPSVDANKTFPSAGLHTAVGNKDY